MEYYTAIKKSKLQWRAKQSMNLRVVMLREKNQAQKTMIPLIWSLETVKGVQVLPFRKGQK